MVRLIHTLLQTSVSLKRIQDFLNQDELDPQCVERKTISPGPNTLTSGRSCSKLSKTPPLTPSSLNSEVPLLISSLLPLPDCSSCSSLYPCSRDPPHCPGSSQASLTSFYVLNSLTLMHLGPPRLCHHHTQRHLLLVQGPASHPSQVASSSLTHLPAIQSEWRSDQT